MLRYLYNRYRRNKMLSKIKCGNNVYIDSTVDIYSPEKLIIGNNVHIQFGCKFFADGGITIEEGSIIAHDVQVLTRNHNYDSADLEMIPYDSRYVEKPVNIGGYCWVGARVTIIPGVSIGKGVVVAAGSVVTKDIPDYAVCGGNPAKVLKYRDSQKFEKLLEDNKGYIKCTKKYE